MLLILGYFHGMEHLSHREAYTELQLPHRRTTVLQKVQQSHQRTIECRQNGMEGNIELMSVPKITQHYQVFAYVIEMLLDNRLDSAGQMHSAIIIHSATSVSKCDTIVSMLIALQSYNDIDGNVRAL